MIDGRAIIARILIRGLMEGNKLGGRGSQRMATKGRRGGRRGIKKTKRKGR